MKGSTKEMVSRGGCLKYNLRKLQKTVNKDFAALSKSFNYLVIIHFWTQFGHTKIFCLHNAYVYKMNQGKS